MGLRATLDAVAKRKKSHHGPCRELNTGRPARNLVSILTELHLLYMSIKVITYAGDVVWCNSYHKLHQFPGQYNIH